MNVSTELQYAGLDNFYLDPKNPRLDRQQKEVSLSQKEILEIMGNWDLDELAMSYLENGFWRYEALLVVKEELDGKQRFVNDYRSSDDFQKVYRFLETLYISSRLVLPLKGIILIGY